jgi:CII-binding regulator of phage lambda lysogenization HflD
VATDLGNITGYASLHPDDKDIASSFAGCRYAEMRAGIKYMKKKIQISKYQLKPLKRIYNELIRNKRCNKNSKGIKLLEKEIYILEDDIKSYETNIKTLTERLQKAINSRDDIIKNMINKQGNE